MVEEQEKREREHNNDEFHELAQDTRIRGTNVYEVEVSTHDLKRRLGPLLEAYESTGESIIDNNEHQR